MNFLFLSFILLLFWIFRPPPRLFRLPPLIGFPSPVIPNPPSIRHLRVARFASYTIQNISIIILPRALAVESQTIICCSCCSLSSPIRKHVGAKCIFSQKWPMVFWITINYTAASVAVYTQI